MDLDIGDLFRRIILFLKRTKVCQRIAEIPFTPAEGFRGMKCSISLSLTLSSCGRFSCCLLCNVHAHRTIHFAVPYTARSAAASRRQTPATQNSRSLAQKKKGCMPAKPTVAKGRVGTTHARRGGRPIATCWWDAFGARNDYGTSGGRRRRRQLNNFFGGLHGSHTHKKQQ